MITIREYRMKGDGIQAPGAIVLRVREDNHLHPFVVHFRNDQCGGFAHGDYCKTLTEAEKVFVEKCKRYDPTGTLHY